MAKKLNESYTEFGAVGNQSNQEGRWWTRAWKKFSGSKLPDEINPYKEMDIPEEEKMELDILRGDVIHSEDPTAPTSIGRIRYSYSSAVPQAELSRRKRYRDYEDMDFYPDIAAALDMYADDATIKDKDGEVIHIRSNHKILKEEIKKFFKSVKINNHIWDIARNTAKYGDSFIENIHFLKNPKKGIGRIKPLNPNFIHRKEDEYGVLKSFTQEIPDKTTYLSVNQKSRREFTLDKNQLVHFRVRTSDSAFIPYGKSILAPAAKIYKQLRLMEDAMFIYRVQRAPERRVFSIDIGQLPPHKAETFIEKIKQKFKKEKYYDPSQSKIEERFNPMGVNEDFFLGVRPGGVTKIDTLPGAENLGEIDDVKYFREKILGALKIPKDYFSINESTSQTNKGTLRQLDVKYARAVGRLQEQIILGLLTLVKRHLTLRGFPDLYLNEFELYFNSPSNAEEREKLELDEQRARSIQAYKGLELFPDEYLYTEFFGFNEEEAKEMKLKMDKQKEEMAELANPPMEEEPMMEEEPSAIQNTENGEIRGNPGEAESDTGAEEEI